MDFEVSPITLSPDYLIRREYYTGPATAVREFIHNSKYKGCALNAARQWTDLTVHKVGEEQWSCLSFLDDGCSMDRAELRQAVKFDPPSNQAACTTSRFGEGMKAAAFWLSTARSAIFLFALKGTERTVVLLGGNNERDLDRCSLIIAPDIKQRDGADEMLACAPKNRKSGLRDIIDRLCRLPTLKGCAGNEGSPFDSVQDILQVFADMQRRAETDHAFLVQIWNPRGTEGINAGSGLAAVFTKNPEGPAGTALQTSNEDSKPGLEPLTPGHSSQLEGGPQKTIMLRDKDGKVSDLSSVCQRLFLPQDHQDICGADFYQTREQTTPGPQRTLAMQMYVCGQPVGTADNPWCQVLQAGGKPSARLPIGDGQGCMQLVSLPEHRYGKPGQSRLPASGIIFVGAGSDHTLNLEPIMPDLHARYTNLLPLVVMGSRSETHYESVWRSLCELCGGIQEVTGIISKATFIKACRPCKGGQHMRFLRAICLQPYLALVQASSHASLQYDPSKTDIRTSPAFAQALMRTILKFAIGNELPQQAQAPALSEALGPASPSPAAPQQVKMTSRKRGGPMQDATAENGPGGSATVSPGMQRRKSTRQAAAPELYSPDMSEPTKRAKRAVHASNPQALLHARDDFCPQAATWLAAMATASSPATIKQLATKLRQGLNTLSRAL